MALDIDELITRAKEYVELEADTKVLEVTFVERFILFGQEDVVLSIKTTDKEEAEWWVVGGSTPINLYAKSRYSSADEVFSLHTGLMLRMLQRQRSQSEETPETDWYDAFICHASEDKDDLVRPLAKILRGMGFRIWYDEYELRIGDSLRKSIDRGLVNSEYGIVVLSTSFFAKNWPQYELEGLTAREMDGGKVILPIWHKISKEEILSYSPTLADKVALISSGSSIEDLASGLAKILGE